MVGPHPRGQGPDLVQWEAPPIGEASVDVVVELERARRSSDQRAWADAYDAFTAVDVVEPLRAADLELLGEAAIDLGRGDDAIRALQRAYRLHVESAAIGDAVRCAFWIWRSFLYKGDFTQAGAWIARAARLAESRPECAEGGYVLLAEADGRHAEGDYAAASAAAARAVELGQGCGDQDLVTVGTHIQGKARIYEGRISEGLALLDEAMLPITAGETSTLVSGWIYCRTISTCHELHELRRAREWTVALNAWCDTSPQFTGAYLGVCRIHRSELLQLGGQWRDAAREAHVACDLVTQGLKPSRVE
jgi:tetratricopeptide (TPR) repeat protein